MKTITKLFTTLALASGLILTTTSCNKEEGQLKISMTDAAADDENIKGVFVTVANVYVDGDKLKGFDPKTIEISAYQNGEIYGLLDEEIEAENYSEISLEFDYEEDANGDEPGCYVLTDQDERKQMKSNRAQVDVKSDITISENTTSEVVIDMDLRKSVERSSSGSYSFVNDSEFDASFRAVKPSTTGQIQGNVDGSLASDDKLVVYAYAKGSYSESQKNVSSNSNTRFRGAVTSASVNASGNYTLPFLEEGSYEVHVMKYKTRSNGQVDFESEVEIQSLLSDILPSDIGVSANATVTLDLNVF